MPDRIVGSVEGVAETQAAFVAFAERAQNDQAAAAAAAAIVAAAASGLAPIRTGALAGSYGVSDRFVVNPLPYAGPVEYGVPSLGMAPRFVVTNAWEQNAAAIEAAYSAWLAEQARALGFEATAG